MERKGRTTIRRQRRSRSWLFSPIIIAQLAVVMVVAGVGVAFALPSGTPDQTTAPWIGTSAITDGVLEVVSYDFGFSADYTKVSKVLLTIENTDDSNPHSGTVEVNIGGTVYPGTISSIPAGETTSTPVEVTLGTGIALASVTGNMYIVVKN